MICPMCENRSLLRDHASPRAYGFIFFGFFMLVAARLFLPLLEPLYILPYHAAVMALRDAGVERTIPFDLTAAARLHDAIRHAFSIGLVALLFGAVDMWRDGARYCPVCGFRGRFIRNRSDAEMEAALAHVRTRRHEHAQESGVSPDQPVAPLLKMLRFKNDAMRRQAVSTLQRLTGQNFGEDAEAWERWYAEQGAEFERTRGRA